MNEALRGLVREWMEKAESDWRIAWHDMQTDDPTPDMVCFHMQQCVEKYLKAFLVLHQVSFRRTHDIQVREFVRSKLAQSGFEG